MIVLILLLIIGVTKIIWEVEILKRKIEYIDFKLTIIEKGK